MAAASAASAASAAVVPRAPVAPGRSWSRAVIDRISPEVDGGRFAVKRCIGDRFTVEADAFTDGHDRIRCRLRHRTLPDGVWREVEMRAAGNDRWQAAFDIDVIGRHEYTVTAWVDAFGSWRHDLERRVDEEDIALALRIGALLVEAAAARVDGGADHALLVRAAGVLGSAAPLAERRALALSDPLLEAVDRHPDRRHATTWSPALPLVADPALAGFSAWYELFPRSMAAKPGAHGSLRDVESVVANIAAMGFDILYLPPIHPIGRVNRKGPNNALVATEDDPGSPWAIGSSEGGHRSIHAELGTGEDLRALVDTCRLHGLELALDIAFQCAPDHPWVEAHPQWFQWRPDGSVQYAENPPKKYQDIYPLHFENDDHASLFEELKGVILHWVEHGVTVFRVDNPHTKPFAFWEWAIGEIKAQVPQAIFLAEAFTRPKVMHRLAKLGFSQSYTYFTWRNTGEELGEYLLELSSTPGVEYFRPNFWPNTPDILHETLQTGGRAAFIVRLVLAATMTANYGVYGPAYELLEREPREPGSEEYRDSEKYQIRQRDLRRADSMAGLMTNINRIRKQQPALQQDRNARVLETDNPQLFAFCKWTSAVTASLASDTVAKSDAALQADAKLMADANCRIVVIVNLDFRWPQSGFVNLPASIAGTDGSERFEVEDLLNGERYRWTPGANYVRLSPDSMPVHVLRILAAVSA